LFSLAPCGLSRTRAGVVKPAAEGQTYRTALRLRSWRLAPLTLLSAEQITQAQS